MSNPTPTGVQPAPSAAASPVNTAVLFFPPLVHVFFGAFLLVVFFIGCLMSMQTTESLMQSLKSANLAPNLAILGQFPRFFAGTLGEDLEIAFVTAFIVQMNLLVTKVGLAVVHARVARKYANVTPTAGMQKSAKTRMNIWTTLSFVSLAVNAIADCVYAWHLGWWQAIFFSLVMFLGTFYFGNWGIQNITAGMNGASQ